MARGQASLTDTAINFLLPESVVWMGGCKGKFHRALRLSSGTAESKSWITPHPIAGGFGDAEISILRRLRLSAIVRFIPADRIEQERTILRPAIAQRLAIDDIMGSYWEVRRNKGIERFRKTTVRLPEALQSTCYPRQIH